MIEFCADIMISKYSVTSVKKNTASLAILQQSDHLGNSLYLIVAEPRVWWSKSEQNILNNLYLYLKVPFYLSGQDVKAISLDIDDPGTIRGQMKPLTNIISK